MALIIGYPQNWARLITQTYDWGRKLLDAVGKPHIKGHNVLKSLLPVYDPQNPPTQPQGLCVRKLKALMTEDDDNPYYLIRDAKRCLEMQDLANGLRSLFTSFESSGLLPYLHHAESNGIKDVQRFKIFFQVCIPSWSETIS